MSATDRDAVLRQLQEQGYAMIPDFLNATQLATVNALYDALLGYSIHPPFIGQVTASHPLKTLQPGYVPPAFRKSETL